MTRVGGNEKENRNIWSTKNFLNRTVLLITDKRENISGSSSEAKKNQARILFKY